MSTIDVKVPDIGDFSDVPVIEVFVKPGDAVAVDDSLVTLESDKATMDVPSPATGTVQRVSVKVGDKVSEGSVVLTLETNARASSAERSEASEGGAGKVAREATANAGGIGREGRAHAAPPTDANRAAPPPPTDANRSVPSIARAPSPQPSPAQESTPSPLPRAGEGPGVRATEAPSAPAEERSEVRAAHASPSVRRFARELGVDIAKVDGSGPKGRILHEDVQQFVKRALAMPAAGAPAAAVSGGGALNLLPWPTVDFSKFGPVETKPLSRIKKISGANLARNWVMIPHVTQFDDADISELETLRVALNRENEKAGIKVTMLAFLIKASVAALRTFPDFNASLDGENLVYKRYFNIGFAADTPNGLVVPVLKGVDSKGVLQIAKEMTDLSAKAREGKLGPADMQGGCFSISSLGGIDGTAFTPIINAPEVAILGVSRSAMKPVWDGNAFAPRLMLPLSLSYDHRVIDGAQAARFISYFASVLADFRRALL